ncbi:hypothetical protein FA95DRAFT_933202 [Auriscalpium vulgare]|uniref:Uncharacterized protein n=1 Tax=Auriscalpium vulgare TaxID=40419 RepID=A0ACB8SAD7_9AGAM|nr:hypothetical protein FA95DRAFT_933202 [Auriscalpium vulgare]
MGPSHIWRWLGEPALHAECMCARLPRLDAPRTAISFPMDSLHPTRLLTNPPHPHNDPRRRPKQASPRHVRPCTAHLARARRRRLLRAHEALPSHRHHQRAGYIPHAARLRRAPECDRDPPADLARAGRVRQRGGPRCFLAERTLPRRRRPPIARFIMASAQAAVWAPRRLRGHGHGEHVVDTVSRQRLLRGPGAYSRRHPLDANARSKRSPCARFGP